MNSKQLNSYALVCGAMTLVLGVVVMAGWHTGNAFLIQVNPDFVPMQYNTALCFLLSGLAIVMLVFKKQVIPRLCAGGLLLVAAATLLQYLLQTDFGIDELLMEHAITTKTSHPGRMAPNTALLFSLTGLAIILDNQKHQFTISLAVAIFVLSILFLTGYLIHEESIYGWGNLTRMAFHTACGFILVGSGLIMYVIGRLENREFSVIRLVPLSTATVIVIATLLVWYSVQELTRARNDHYFRAIIQETQIALMDRFELYKQGLIGGLGLFYASKSVERREWQAYVRALDINRTLPGINGIGYIDYLEAEDIETYVESVRADDYSNFNIYPETEYSNKFVTRFIEPVINNQAAVGLDIGFEKNRRTAAERSRDLGVPMLTNRIELVQDEQHQAGFLLLIPVYDVKETPDTLEDRRKHLQGWVYAPFIGANFFEGLSNTSHNQLEFSVYDGVEQSPEALIYSNSQSPNTVGQTSAFATSTVIENAGRAWTIYWQASEQFEPPGKNYFGTIIVSFGLLLAALLYVTLNHLINSKEIIRRLVTERTAELKEALSFQDLVTSSIPDLVFVKDADSRIVQANNSFLSLYPEDMRDSVIGSTTLEKFHNEEVRAFLQHDTTALEQGYSETEETIMFPDGSQHTLVTRKTRFENTQGEKFILGIAHDITHIKLAEQQILKANDELKRSNDELERFAYIASHDLQAPLRRIGGFTKQLEKQLAGQLDGRTKTFMDFITSGVENMSELIQGLLAYSRITIDEIRIQSLDSNKIVELAENNLSETIAENSATILYKDLPEVAYNKVMLTQLFQNLIGNAIRYRSDKPPVIKISSKRLTDGWEFSVEDNGIGIEEKYLEKIFEMFQRLHSSDKISGTGIGLSLCQKIVERYGGSMRVTSTPGVGSIFYFTVPLAKMEQAA